MTSKPIVTQLALLPDALLPPKKSEKQRCFHTFWQHPELLPPFVAQCPVARRYLELLGPLAWADFPERNLQRPWRHPAIPFQTLILAELIRLEEGLPTFGKLHRFLAEHPSLVWLLGFPLYPAPNQPLGFNARKSLPTARHFTRLLRRRPNLALRTLLAQSVQLICAELQTHGITVGECISLDTKHILAWVQENNPKVYVSERYNKSKQPHGDPDCRLGCKRQRNQTTPTTTPQRNPVSARKATVGEYYWGYGSGVVATKAPGWGEFVLAELTQPFDQGDVTYFFPLLQQTEAHLGRRPRIGTFDAAFDAWYVYAYFYEANDPRRSFAAVPFSEKGGFKANARHFAPDGTPLCAAHLAMPLQFTFTDRTACLVEHERGKYVCPLRFPTLTAHRCPVTHPRWKKGGCTAMMPTSIGARLRYTLDRESAEYKDAYRQRTAIERINAQAVALGIERPHLRSGKAIANQNTSIYLLINLRFLQRLRLHRREND